MGIFDSVVSGVLGLGGSILGASSQQKQMLALLRQQQAENKRNLARQEQLNMPLYQAQIQSLRGLQQYANQANTERYQTDPALEASRQLSMNELNRQMARSQQSTNYMYGSNVGRATGALTRTGRQYVQSANNINMSAYQQDASNKMAKTQQYLNTQTAIGNIGGAGTNALNNAYNNYSQNAMNIIGQTPVNSTLSDLGGMLLGYGMSGLLNQPQQGTSQYNQYNPNPVNQNAGRGKYQYNPYYR